jgi:L-lactate dehydrogenase complex protein LldE
MMVHHYPRILEGEWRERALALSAKTFELTTFLAEVARPAASDPPTSIPLTVTYHDGCAGLRELNIRNQPRQLLKSMCGIDIKELEQAEVCCGFGGTFCAKMPALSGKMVDDKLANACASGAQLLTGGDLGCLLNIAGRAHRQGIDIEVRHVAELLAGDLDAPGIGDAQ